MIRYKINYCLDSNIIGKKYPQVTGFDTSAITRNYKSPILSNPYKIFSFDVSKIVFILEPDSEITDILSSSNFKNCLLISPRVSHILFKEVLRSPNICMIDIQLFQSGDFFNYSALYGNVFCKCETNLEVEFRPSSHGTSKSFLLSDRLYKKLADNNVTGIVYPPEIIDYE